ncbi:hypothetical protein PFAG_02198 [Plasmodium falciparum Santa Lucia]|uniref:Uncharacterized protein n=2 Tax=Plasmodium falciparum TaxID=5833 RepID=W7G7Z3_PLAFA|nr:hypothetical protein PFAG_02198 [Plasmodium falciparum Santa Lucia]
MPTFTFVSLLSKYIKKEKKIIYILKNIILFSYENFSKEEKRLYCLDMRIFEKKKRDYRFSYENIRTKEKKNKQNK